MQEITLQSVSSDISGFITNYADECNIKRVGLFGSVSRGDNNLNSDIDIIAEYDFNGVFNMDNYVKYCIFCSALKESFEELYSCKVDVVDYGQLFYDESMWSEEVSKDVKWIYVNR